MPQLPVEYAAAATAAATWIRDRSQPRATARHLLPPAAATLALLAAAAAIEVLTTPHAH